MIATLQIVERRKVFFMSVSMPLSSISFRRRLISTGTALREAPMAP
jgi:hypothetical protein